ncbi:pyridoxal 5'-phosphate synthase glutaminase subunit PdxT [Patescibacteria group bacterium]|nr:pyridoxal 5'-phosphate synthase glutaminase subunit PdxT [Patescibacteria group bacterium]MBU1682389.1 pyridoxal 5'-phosphate synthase glutaminase subunit PdxT [Patescibacteria group bacterium]
MSKQQKTIGIFALQGAFVEHQRMMEKLGAEVFLIRSLSDVKDKKIDGVVLPGGESTTMTKLLKKTGLDKWLKGQGESGLPIFGTCAGMIILSQMGLVDADVDRNAYGSQLDSFETELTLESGLLRSPDSRYDGVFIRAPKVKKIGSNVKVLAKYGKTPVLIQQGKIMTGSFHPELTQDSRIHEYFLEI